MTRRRHLGFSIFGDGPPDDPAQERADVAAAAPTRVDGRRRSERVRVRGTRRLIVLLGTLVLVAGAGGVAVVVVLSWLSGITASNDYTGNGTGRASVIVHAGDTSRTIADALEKARVVKTAKAFSNAAADDSRSGSIQPGTYALRTDMSAVAALAMLLDPVNRSVPRVTIREGLWTSEVIAKLAASTGQPLADYQAALKDPAMLGLPAAARGGAEGYLFPATYDFDTKDTAAEQLNTMVAKTLEELDKLGVTDEKMQRMLTIASVVEAEAKAKTDRPKVARVIENRLAKPMRLQMDSTVHFISQRRGTAGTTEAERLSKNPYNTYLRTGLPPGPINSPGLDAMAAAVTPTRGSWMYFVAVNPETGATKFAVNAAGHAANVRVFQKWCSDHPGKC